jgi:hypothetical protein
MTVEVNAIKTVVELPRLAQNEERDRISREARRGRRMGQKETAMTGEKRPMIFD